MSHIILRGGDVGAEILITTILVIQAVSISILACAIWVSYVVVKSFLLGLAPGIIPAIGFGHVCSHVAASPFGAGR